MLITQEYLKEFVPECFLTDERYRWGHLHILAPAEGTRILGMHTPEMKKVAKDLVRCGDWLEQLELWAGHRPLKGAEGLLHEEQMIWGLIIDYIKVPLDERLKLIEEFIPAIDNWAICDNFCCNSKWVEKEDKARIWPYVEGLIASEDEFRARTGLVLALAHFLDSDNISRTLAAIEDRGYQEDAPFYIRMAAAWLFAEALSKNYETTLPYLLDGRLSRWIHNKSIQKARESFRITPEQKTYLSTLKRHK